MSKRFNKLISLFAISAVACFIVAGIFLCLPFLTKTNLAVAETETRFTNVTATELAWDGTYRRTNGSNPAALLADRGMYVVTGTNSQMAVGATFKIPENVTGDYSIKMETYFQKIDKWDTSRGEFRLVLNNKILFPVEGGWFDLYNASQTVSGGLIIDKAMASLPAFTMKAGDELHFMFRDPNGISNWANYQCTFGMTINGKWFDATIVEHMSGVEDDWLVKYAYTGVDGLNYLNYGADNQLEVVENSDYFNGQDVTCAELFQYNEYSWADIGNIIDLHVDTYESKTITTNQTAASDRYDDGSINKGLNYYGAEYVVFDVTNASGAASYVELDFYEGIDTGTFGQAWTIANFAPYYIEERNSFTTVGYSTERSTSYLGSIPVPAGFDGKIYVPVDSFNQIGWQYNRNKQTMFGEMYEMYLKQVFVDVRCGAASGMVINSVCAIGSDLESIANTSNTAYNLIRKIGVVNAGSQNIIANAREVYNSLDETNKNAVSNYADLVKAEQTYASLTVDASSIANKGKDFTGTEGITLNTVYANAPATVSAWIKVGTEIDDRTHVGTVIGNREMNARSQCMFDKTGIFSVEITTNGNPRFIWKKGNDTKFYWTVNNVDVRTGEWLNLAFTRNVETETISCYINGVLVASMETEAKRINDFTFIKPVMIGSDYMDNEILSYAYTPDFNGSIADVKVYANVLSAEEIATNLNAVVSSKGLMTNVALANGESAQYLDSATNVYAVDAYSFKDATINDLKLGDYSMAVFGDTQMYLSVAKDNEGDSLFSPNYDKTTNRFYQNVQWLIANKDAMNLKFLMHMGDLTDNLNSSATYEITTTGEDGTPTTTTRRKGYLEMDYAMEFMDMLTEAGIPWSLNRGNHDTDPYFDEVYNYKKYGSLPSGTYDNSMRNTYYKFTAGGLKYMVVSFDLNASASARDWANEVISANPDHLVIITIHSYLSSTGAYNSDSMGISTVPGQTLWNEVASQHKNVFMVLSGHSSGTDIVRDVKTGVNGNAVHEVMIDESKLNYFMYDQPQGGVFSILGFENGGDTIHFNFYSSGLGKLFRGWNQFTINIDASSYISNEKSDYSEIATPKFNAFGVYSSKYGTIYANSKNSLYCAYDSSLGMSGIYTQDSAMKTIVPALVFEMPKDGIFSYDASSWVNVQGKPWAYFGAFIIDAETNQSIRYMPKGTTTATTSNGVNYSYMMVKNGSYYEYFIKYKNAENISIADLSAPIYLNKGDKVVLYLRSGSSYYNFSITANVLDDNGVITKYDAISGLGNTADKTEHTTLVKSLYDVGYGKYDENGESINLDGWSLVWFANSDAKTNYVPYKYTLTVKDNSGATISSMMAPIEIQVPNLKRDGQVFLGYSVGDTLYPAGSVISITANTTATAVFANVNTLNEAALRVGNNAGIKFTTTINADLASYGLTVRYGTIIAKASAVTTENGVDCSLLTLETAGDVIDLKSTVQVIDGDTVYVNGSILGLSYDTEVVARGYAIITYEDGTEVIVYANVTDNSRSVRELAKLALADIKETADEKYCYEVEGGYSCYDSTVREIIASYLIG